MATMLMQPASVATGMRPATPGADIVARVRCAKRLFCTAYISPEAPGQGGQEAIVAKYPLAIVPQDDGAHAVAWRDRVRRLNPSIILLGYQQVIEETTVPGPGHERMRQVQGAWATYPGGFVPTVRGPAGSERHIFDPRNADWQQAFVEACGATLAAYPYDGLFLDQCTVYTRASLSPLARAEMRSALQATLLRLRRGHPAALLVGNSARAWNGLNGELNEARLADMASACASTARHAVPEIKLYQSLLGRATSTESVQREMALAHKCGAFFGAAADYQHVPWLDAFDAVRSPCT